MLNRLAPPPTRPFGRVDLPKAEVSTLANGARLHLLPHDAQPVIRLQIVLPAGRWYDTAPGTSLLAARAILEGTPTRSARQIAEQIAFYGASLECEQGFDRATLTLFCLSRHFSQLLPIVQDVLLNASYPTSEVEQIKTRTIQNIKVERQKTSYRAVERFSQNLYGPTHPYGLIFNEQTFQHLSSEDIQAFHRQAYNLAQAEIFLCGDITSEHVAEIKNALAITTNSADAAASSAVVSPSTHEDYVTVTDSLQASLRLGRLWPAAQHPDTHKLQVLIKVLGGYFGSRLMKNIREEKGLTYGIYASISHREHASSLIIGSDVNASNARIAVDEIHKEMGRLQNELIPDEELHTVKNYILGKFLNELGTVFEQADKYRSTVLLGLPTDFYSRFLTEVDSVTADELQGLAQEYLSPATLTEVIAGPQQ